MWYRSHITAAIVDGVTIGATPTGLIPNRRIVSGFNTVVCAPVSMIAVNESYAGAEVLLHDGDELAFIPPVAGG